MEGRSCRRHPARRRRVGLFGNRLGQAAVEYLLTTLVLVTAFSGLYGFMQGQLKRLFTGAAIRILTSYP